MSSEQTLKQSTSEVNPAPSTEASPDTKDNSTVSLHTKSSPVPSQRKTSNKGRHGDPRMHRAVAARLLDPELSLLEALIEGGFAFPDGTEGTGKSDRNVYDTDGVLLCQRKNQLSRRLRLAKKRQQIPRANNNVPSSNMIQQDHGDSRTLQNMLLNGQLPVTGNEVPMITSNPFSAPFFPAQPASAIDNAAPQGNDQRPKRQAVENTLDQYLQLTARSMGLRPEQFRDLRYPTNPMFPGFNNAVNPFQTIQSMSQQQPNFLAAMEQQRGSSVMDNSTAAGINMQNLAIMAMQQQPQFNNNDLSRMLLNRTLLMNGIQPQDQNDK